MSFINKFIDKAKGASRHQSDNATPKEVTKSIETSSSPSIDIHNHSKTTSSQDEEVQGKKKYKYAIK